MKVSSVKALKILLILGVALCIVIWFTGLFALILNWYLTEQQRDAMIISAVTAFVSGLVLIPLGDDNESD